MRSMKAKMTTTTWRLIWIVIIVVLVAVGSAHLALSTTQSTSAHPTICGEMAKAIKALPPSTDLYDWPDLINFPGLRHPRYHKEDPQQHVDLITTSTLYFYPKQRKSLAAPIDEATWQKTRIGVERQIHEGFWTVESTTLNIEGLGKTTLYRLGTQVPSVGTLGSGAKGPPRLVWFYAIGESEQVPQARHWPLEPAALRHVDLLMINGKPYFALLPGGELVKLMFPPGFTHLHAAQVCEFNLWPRRKP